ncbi:MAG: T9SS type A sorting domain-containing protein [Phycisphaerae bacterium]|nr:T9SS type A sorting domain-containing protein [Saprospiraceae bacterium]
MRHTRMLFLLGVLCSGLLLPSNAHAQTCGPDGVVDTSSFSGTAFFNYGSSARLTSQKYRSSAAVGQTFVGYIDGLMNNSTLGFYSRYLLAPFALSVTATQGDLLDRIQLSWEIDAVGPSPTEGFNIYRDGIFLAAVGPNIRNYNDFNVIAGRPYVYTVSGLNVYGEGTASTALGFQIPNGVVTGWVQTATGAAVPDAIVTLMPMQGFSAKFGPMDGAFAEADSSGNPFMPAPGEDWTMTFWIKTDSATVKAGLIQLAPFPLYFRALNSASGHEGVEIAASALGAPFLNASFPDSIKNGWQHVALSFDGNGEMGRLYINGVLADLAPMNIVAEATELNLGSRTGTGGWAGRLDELRIYHKQLNELDFREVMEGTASSLTPDLTHYWKMDEELGVKSYDIMKRLKLYFCGANFDAERPNVHTAGKTNQQGYYRIESANYGTGTTFLAEPMKDFFMHRSLKMVRDQADYATLPDFSLTAKATLELWVNSAGPNGTQCLISKRWVNNDFRLLAKQNGLLNEVWFYLNGQEHNFGNLGMGYQHLAFTIDSSGSNRTVTAFKNGIPFGSPHTFSSTGNWSDPTQNWVLGARPSGVSYTDHFGGLMDEVALYDTTLSPTAILSHFQNTRDMQERGLRAYFAIDEGTGNSLNNSGSAFLPPGTNVGAEWSPFAANQTTEPHIFTPGTRQVTLNPSVTSVDQVDFTDRSSIPVSGFVRFKDTDCFAQNVEILVNGASYYPPVFTDSTGKFIVELDPGTTAVLSPKLEDHTFSPASRNVFNVNAPIAGILFNDLTKRRITGQVAGGHCKLPIIAPTGSAFPTDCRITVSTKDKCYEREMLINTEDGLYEFDNLPPLEVTIAITKHNNPKIYDDFQAQGGRTINLLKQDSFGVEFIYIAPPQVQVAGFDAFTKDNCPDKPIVIGRMDIVDLFVKAYEQYGSDQDPDYRCYLDSATLSINNTFDYNYDFLLPLDTFYTGGEFHYRFVADHPNQFPPYEQFIEITADDMGRKSEPYENKAIITGIIVGESKFTTQLPMLPSFVLRDPPGDGSYAFLEKETKHCNSLNFGEEAKVGLGVTFTGSGGAHNEITIPLIGTHIEFIASYENSSEFTTTITQIHEHSMQYCVSNKERISTDDGNLVVGGATILDNTHFPLDTLAGNDVFVGVGFNVIFSESKEVKFNDTLCVTNVNNIVTVSPDTFVTNYKYSEWNIENNVVRYLDTLIAHGIDQDSINSKSKKSWLAYMALNKLAKKTAIYDQNISFDAGVVYESSETTDNSTTYSNAVKIELENVLTSQLLIGLLQPAVILFDNAIKVTVGLNGLIGTGGSSSEVMTTGYVLKDDDPGDTWTMDVKKDPIFKTPVFDIKAGQTSCPWEVGTAHRQGVNMVELDGVTRTNVPSNEAASFHFQLQNLSSTGETFTYVMNTGPESNPDGLIISLNGIVLDKPVKYAVPYGTTIPITITAERGPDAYSYHGTEVVFYAECHDDRSAALGFAPDFETYLYSAKYLNVDFLKPCSEVDITGPFQGWVVKPDELNPAEQNNLAITVSGYDLDNDDFESIRLQYRPENGDGAWINITPPTDIPKAQLGPVFTTYQWDTGGSPALADGPYEIRAVSVCTGGGDKNGYSHVIKGKIERQPPSLIGTPEPSDGVYNVGDEISFSFNKLINCAKINPVDNVQLFDATTNLPIDIAITCYENKILLVPNFDNKYFENRILRAELHDIEDLTGNRLVYTQWEFYVDRNELAWLTDSLGMTKYEDQNKTAVANIHNRGGYPVPFTITGIPNWVHVVPDQGTLAPNEIRPVSFQVDSNLAFGLWSDSITLHTETGQNPFFMGGDEGLPFGVRVVCRPPVWEINPNLFENSENMVLELNIQGEISKDVEDIVVAFIGDTIVGRANVQYVPAVNKYLAYLSIYGNPNHVLEPLRLEIWDASACLRYAVEEDDFLFQPDDVLGDPLSPQVIHTNSYVLRDVSIGFGWNWLSFNLDFPDPDLDSALVSLKYPENDLMKGQNAFATYLNGAGWLGSLNTLGNTSMYIYRADQADTLKMLGTVLNPATNPISVVSGWNWIGYIPNYSLAINPALSSLSPQMGDLIKSQESFAQYINPTFGWIGNLQYMQPPKGYQIKLSTPGTLIYPPPSSNLGGGGADHIASARGPNDGVPPAENFWSVDPTQFEYSMTLIGMLEKSDSNATTSTMELGAFVGNQVRGSSQAIYIPPYDSYLFFLTVYANSSGEQVKYKLFDSNNGAVQDLNEAMYFSPDLHQGSIENPVPFTLPSSGTQDLAWAQSFEVQPNPFHTETMFRFALPSTQEVSMTVVDVSGRAVSTIHTTAREGLNTMVWKGQSDKGTTLAAGVYFVRLQTSNVSVVRKVVLQ